MQEVVLILCHNFSSLSKGICMVFVVIKITMEFFLMPIFNLHFNLYWTCVTGLVDYHAITFSVLRSDTSLYPALGRTEIVESFKTTVYNRHFSSELLCSWHQTVKFMNFILWYGILVVVLCISETPTKVAVYHAFTSGCQNLLPVLIALFLVLESGVPWLINVSYF
jgi:hypothetical protein